MKNSTSIRRVFDEASVTESIGREGSLREGKGRDLVITGESPVTTRPKTSESQNIVTALEDGNVEIRAIQKTDIKPVIWSGVFDDYDCLVKSARYAERKGFDVYMGLNPSDMGITNNIKPFRRTVKDKNITRIRRLLFDLDPVRESGSPSTDEQISEAWARMNVLIGILHNWSTPMIAFSGNGYHLQYRCDLENTPDTAKMLSGLYAGLKIRISTAEVDFDSTVRNPSRITRFYGTTNHKSGRRSECTIPEKWEITHSGVIIKTSQELTPPKPMVNPARRENEERRGKFIRNWDIVSAFHRAGLYISPAEESGKHFVTCFNASQHSETGPKDTVIWEGEWPQYHCSHNHCEHLNILDAIGFCNGA